MAKNKKESETWLIESVDRYYFWSGRNQKTYKEITFWYNPQTCARKETVRSEFIQSEEEHKLPDWCNSCVYRKSLNYD